MGVNSDSIRDMVIRFRAECDLSFDQKAIDRDARYASEIHEEQEEFRASEEFSARAAVYRSRQQGKIDADLLRTMAYKKLNKMGLDEKEEMLLGPLGDRPKEFIKRQVNDYLAEKLEERRKDSVNTNFDF